MTQDALILCPFGYRPIEDGEVITKHCLMMSATGIWIPITTTVIGKEYQDGDFIRMVAIPIEK